jgi:hypothetical protein
MIMFMYDLVILVKIEFIKAQQHIKKIVPSRIDTPTSGRAILPQQSHTLRTSKNRRIASLPRASTASGSASGSRAQRARLELLTFVLFGSEALPNISLRKGQKKISKTLE